MSPSRQKRDRQRERHARVRALLRPQFSAQLLTVWEHACWVWSQICDLFASPRALAMQEWIGRAEYRDIEGWLRPLEQLTRRLLFVAALAIDVVLKPIRQIARTKRPRRVRLAWPAKPETWKAHFRLMWQRTDKSCEPANLSVPNPGVMPTFPLARRIEAVRRVLAAPDKRVHCLAVRLARQQARNLTAAEPRLFATPEWDDAWCVSKGMLMVSDGMKIITPLARNAFAAWNQNAHPG
jgi:hypothetical protein